MKGVEKVPLARAPPLTCNMVKLVTPGITCYKFNVDISNSGKKGPVSPAFLPELLVSTLGL